MAMIGGSTTIPLDIDNDMWCHACQGVVRHMLVELGPKKSEMDVNHGFMLGARIVE